MGGVNWQVMTPSQLRVQNRIQNQGARQARTGQGPGAAGRRAARGGGGY